MHPRELEIAALGRLYEQGLPYPDVEVDNQARDLIIRLIAKPIWWDGYFTVNGQHVVCTCRDCKMVMILPVTREGAAMACRIMRVHPVECCPDRIRKFNGRESVWPDEEITVKEETEETQDEVTVITGSGGIVLPKIGVSDEF